MRVLGESWHSFIFFGGRARTVRIFMGKEVNVIGLDPEAYTQSLLNKIDKLVGLKEALIEMFNHNIDHHAMKVVQNHVFDTRDEIESMLDEIKERLKTLKEYHQS